MFHWSWITDWLLYAHVEQTRISVVGRYWRLLIFQFLFCVQWHNSCFPCVRACVRIWTTRDVKVSMSNAQSTFPSQHVLSVSALKPDNITPITTTTTTTYDGTTLVSGQSHNGNVYHTYAESCFCWRAFAMSKKILFTATEVFENVLCGWFSGWLLSFGILMGFPIYKKLDDYGVLWSCKVFSSLSFLDYIVYVFVEL